jgi:hypothetical protein
MQPTIHLERNAGYGRGKNPALRSEMYCGLHFSSVGIIITRESPCILLSSFIYHKSFCKNNRLESVIALIILVCIYFFLWQPLLCVNVLVDGNETKIE